MKRVECVGLNVKNAASCQKMHHREKRGARGRRKEHVNGACDAHGLDMLVVVRDTLKKGEKGFREVEEDIMCSSFLDRPLFLEGVGGWEPRPPLRINPRPHETPRGFRE